MFKVNIYIETTIRGPSKRDGAYIYVLEFVKESGEPVTRQEVKHIKDTTENELVLRAMISALNRLTKDCEIRINTQCQHVLNTVQNLWHIQWEKSDWINSKGKEVKNKELWQQYVKMSRIHVITVLSSEHSYQEWMRRELKKEEEKHSL